MTETNRYYQFGRETEPDPSPCSRSANFEDTTREEIFSFIIITMIMAHVQKNEINYYWSTDEVFEVKFIRKLMKCDRYLQLSRHLENDNDLHGDKLFKVRPVLDDLRSKFRNKMKSFQKLCIDESLMLWRGLLGFRQYIKRKRHRFGVKMFMFCDAEIDYVLDLLSILVQTQN